MFFFTISQDGILITGWYYIWLPARYVCEKAIQIRDCSPKEAFVMLMLQLELFSLAPFSYPSLSIYSVLASILVVKISRIFLWEYSFYLGATCKVSAL